MMMMMMVSYIRIRYQGGRFYLLMLSRREIVECKGSCLFWFFVLFCFPLLCLQLLSCCCLTLLYEYFALVCIRNVPFFPLWFHAFWQAVREFLCVLSVIDVSLATAFHLCWLGSRQFADRASSIGLGLLLSPRSTAIWASHPPF
ncbi:hypothetical protein Dimus_006069 [Dionaea muscipula]